MSENSLGLRKRVFKAGSITLIAFGSGQILRLLTNLAVSRLVSPSDFGLMALATAILVILNLFSDIGLRQCIVRSPNGNDPRMLNTAWTLQVIRGGVLFLVCCVVGLCLGTLVTPEIGVGASVYAHPELPYVIAALGITSLILGFNTARTHIAQRRLELKRPAIVELGSLVMTIFVTLVLAYRNPTVWSFVGGSIAGAFAQVTLNWMLMPGPSDRFLLDPDALREILGFGRWILFSSMVFVLVSNGDRLILGYWFSPSILGLYSIALALATLPELVVGRLLNSVALPALSEVFRSDPIRLSAVYYKIRFPVDIFLLGLSGFLFAASQNLIDLMYDPRYAGAGSLLQILSISAIFARHSLDGCLYMAYGKPQFMSWVHLLKLASMLILVPLGYYFGSLYGAVLAVAIINLPTLPFIYWVNARMGVLAWRREIQTVPAWLFGFFLGVIVISL